MKIRVFQDGTVSGARVRRIGGHVPDVMLSDAIGFRLDVAVLDRWSPEFGEYVQRTGTIPRIAHVDGDAHNCALENLVWFEDEAIAAQKSPFARAFAALRTQTS